jgi:hypothetical protein
MTIEKIFIQTKENKSYYPIIYEGIEVGDYIDVILGNNKYHITSEFDMVNIYPDDVLIAFHFFIIENNKDKMFFDRCFQSIKIDKENVCFLLHYVKWYLKYKNHLCFLLDYNKLVNYIETNKEEYWNLVCVQGFLNSINELMKKDL